MGQDLDKYLPIVNFILLMFLPGSERGLARDRDRATKGSDLRIPGRAVA